MVRSPSNPRRFTDGSAFPLQSFGLRSRDRAALQGAGPMKRVLLVVGVILVALVVVSSAQGPAATAYKVPRLKDGHPDLQGTWTTQTFTPSQRPKRYAGQEFL